MITCKSCDESKETTEFPKNNVSTCKACRRIYGVQWRKHNKVHVQEADKARLLKWRQKPESREMERAKARRHAANNRQKNLEYAQKRQVERKTFINTFKDLPCADCGVQYPPYVMDFDHVRGEKVGDLSVMWSRSLETILTEIEKCDLVCSNCHRIRTYNRSHNIATSFADVG